MAVTREKQLKLWRELVLQFCIHNNLHNLIPTTFPFFKNVDIHRELNADSIEAVINYIIKSGIVWCVFGKALWLLCVLLAFFLSSASCGYGILRYTIACIIDISFSYCAVQVMLSGRMQERQVSA